MLRINIRVTSTERVKFLTSCSPIFLQEEMWKKWKAKCGAPLENLK